MRIVRVVWRLTAIVLWFLAVAVVGVPCMLCGIGGSRRYSIWTRRWGAGLAKILNLRIVTAGYDPAGFSGGLIVSNHQGYLDILVAAAIFPLRFMAMEELKRWPVLGWFVALNKPIWVDRKARLDSVRIAEELAKNLREGFSVLVYPEGGTSDGSSMKPFKSTSFEVIVRENLPVYPILLRYRPAEDGYPVGWYNKMPFIPHVLHTLGQPGIEVKVQLLEPILPFPEEDRKMLASRVRETMLEQYQKEKQS